MTRRMRMRARDGDLRGGTASGTRASACLGGGFLEPERARAASRVGDRGAPSLKEAAEPSGG